MRKKLIAAAAACLLALAAIAGTQLATAGAASASGCNRFFLTTSYTVGYDTQMGSYHASQWFMIPVSPCHDINELNLWNSSTGYSSGQWLEVRYADNSLGATGWRLMRDGNDTLQVISYNGHEGAWFRVESIGPSADGWANMTIYD
jgi:hypothetical protein